MTQEPPGPEALPETFEQFKNSFSYGSRTDMNFKFMQKLSPNAAGEFISGLFEALGRTLDDGETGRLVQHFYEWQVRAYDGYWYQPEENGGQRYLYDDGPFAPLRQALAESRVALFTSSGHFVEGDDPRPFGVAALTQDEAVPRVNEFLRGPTALSSIPASTASRALRARHPGFDVRATERDPNVVFPLERLRELAAEGVIGELAENAYSFVGAASQRWILGEAAPSWAERLRDEAVDAVVLVPV